MRLRICFCGLAFFAWMLVGCAGATEEPTVVPSQTAPPTAHPTAAPTPAPTLTPTLTPIPSPTSPPPIVFESADFPRLSVIVSPAISSGAESQVISFGREDTPTKQDIPRHILMALKGYPGPTVKYQGPAIRVFTVAGLEIGYGNHVANTHKVIAGEPPASGIYPALPIVSGATQLQIRMKPLAFQNGNGFRYVEYENIPTLETLHTQYMNYVYQGISNDGKYYVSIIMPVTMPFLNETIDQVATQAVSATPPVPEQTLLLPVLEKLQSADETEFVPSLAILDEIAVSLTLGQP